MRVALAFVVAMSCASPRPQPREDSGVLAEQTLPHDEPALSPAPDPGVVRTVDVPVSGDLPAVVVRGARAHRMTMLFIPGMCVHPGGFVMSFQHTAASRGDLLAVQGDVSCGGDGAMRRWSYDLEAMDRRIEAAFHAAGLGPPRDVVVIGYSQGAERAEKLVARWPEKYSAAVLMASPVMPSPVALAKADAVAVMAGTLDSQATRLAVEPLRRAGIAASFFSIPEARHGQMGIHPEDTMREALDFVEEKRNVKKGDGSPSHGAPLSR
jgi:pimeloyl-ACP methyl ester carboxylesterase